MEQLVRVAQELAQLAEELQMEVAKFNIGAASTVKHVDEMLKHEKQPVIENKTSTMHHQKHEARDDMPGKSEEKPEFKPGSAEGTGNVEPSLFDDMQPK
ncbi:hypothetical protein [Candidatus Methanoperedens nitratireducens]|uniref:Uncharacterized protein n=1 Tax=Candidatus Methanoperedens nitratireducens TaxID=1392998 RepID=A0A284VI15_9EURY|nr:hypothetical protein [Candidatus Methanoperedens nitroreducens]SNQ58905.1 hypothetical protein MNV_10033 [Candidatus Methanoperedens nitroreducens]